MTRSSILITGQNPASSELVAEAVLNATSILRTNGAANENNTFCNQH